MSTNGGIQVLEEMMLGYTEDAQKTNQYSIFYADGLKQLPCDFLMELLLLFDTGVFDIDTLSSLFDVSISDITLFTDNCPAYTGWMESIATQWTKALQFYEEDIEDLTWMTKYAIKRAEMAIAMEKTLMTATEEMAKELAEDAGWDEDNMFMRIEGQREQRKRNFLIDTWFLRSGFGGLNGDYTST